METDKSVQFQDPSERKIYEINQMLISLLTRQNDILEEIVRLSSNIATLTTILEKFSEAHNFIHGTLDDGK